jgi:predicted ribosome-associated RNA-binding protein Tma20
LKLQSQIEQLTRLNAEHRRRSSLTRRQAQQLVEDKADLQALLHEKDHEVNRIRCQLKRYSGDSDPMVLALKHKIFAEFCNVVFVRT